MLCCELRNIWCGGDGGIEWMFGGGREREREIWV